MGIEIAKNLILSGIKNITLYDNSKIIESDFNSNFFISEINNNNNNENNDNNNNDNNNNNNNNNDNNNNNKNNNNNENNNNIINEINNENNNNNDNDENNSKKNKCKYKYKITLAEASKKGLLQINPDLNISVYQGELSKEISILDSYNIVIISQIINLEMAYNLNQYLREKKIYFIYTGSFGLTGFLFNDFCEDFIILDDNGQEPKKYYIKNITNSEPGKVTIETKNNNYLEIGTGDFVTFKEISGMTELNDTPPRPIIAESFDSFSIEDTSKFQEYVNGGIVEEIKVPKLGVFKTLAQRVSNIYQEDVIEDFLNDNDS